MGLVDETILLLRILPVALELGSRRAGTEVLLTVVQTLNWALGSQGAAPAASEEKGPSTEPGDCRTGSCGLV